MADPYDTTLEEPCPETHWCEIHQHTYEPGRGCLACRDEHQDRALQDQLDRRGAR
jgi:Ni,Fe-hydrogenase I small subunit